MSRVASSRADLVVASSYGPSGASSRVRALQWVSFLGLTAEVHDYLGTSNVRPGTVIRQPVRVLRAELDLRRLAAGPAPERLLLSRSVGPFSGGRTEAALLRRAGRGVYDVDDALWADDRGGVHRWFGEGAGWERSVRAADVVVAGNAYIAEHAAVHNPDVRVIPSCVHPDDYPLKETYSVGEVPRLVWLGSPATERYLTEIAPALLQVHRATGARLTVISAGEAPLGELATMTDRVTWDGARTDALLAQADFGIMPLPDIPYARGKCAYKLLQYGAAALPTVASPVGVNAEVLEDLSGAAATDVDEWVDALTALLGASEGERRARGRAARRAVEERYSYAAWRTAFLDALGLPDREQPPAAGVPEPALRGVTAGQAEGEPSR